MVKPQVPNAKFVIHTDKDLKGGDLTIYNSLGQSVSQIFNVCGQRIVLPVQQLSKGIYYIRITEKNTVIASEKLIRNLILTIINFNH